MTNRTLIQTSKKNLRKKMTDILNALSIDDINRQSSIITKKIIASPEWIQAKRISFYLSMPTAEVQTDDIVLASLKAGKQCFVPLCTKDRMSMLRLKDEEDLKTLPRNNWGIREPKPTAGREDALKSGGLDLIICPGVAFTRQGHRLGHGKGYYDKFLKELKACHQNTNLKPPNVVAVGLLEQILDEVPTNDDDVLIECIVSPE